MLAREVVNPGKVVRGRGGALPDGGLDPDLSSEGINSGTGMAIGAGAAVWRA